MQTTLLNFIDSDGNFVEGLKNVEEYLFLEWKKSNITLYRNWVRKHVSGAKRVEVNFAGIVQYIEFESENYLTLFLLEYSQHG